MMKYNIVWLVVVALLMVNVAVAKEKAALQFVELQGRMLQHTHSTNVQALEGERALVVFWRSDCAPCLKEMALLPEMARQNPELTIVVIALKDAADARAYLSEMPENVRVWVAENEGREVLVAFGNERALALPYSVMLGTSGERCDWFYGILTREKVKQWVEGKREC